MTILWKVTVILDDFCVSKHFHYWHCTLLPLVDYPSLLKHDKSLCWSQIRNIQHHMTRKLWFPQDIFHSLQMHHNLFDHLPGVGLDRLLQKDMLEFEYFYTYKMAWRIKFSIEIRVMCACFPDYYGYMLQFVDSSFLKFDKLLD